MVPSRSNESDTCSLSKRWRWGREVRSQRSEGELGEEKALEKLAGLGDPEGKHRRGVSRGSWGVARGAGFTPHRLSYFVVPWSTKLQDLQETRTGLIVFICDGPFINPPALLPLRAFPPLQAKRQVAQSRLDPPGIASTHILLHVTEPLLYSRGCAGCQDTDTQNLACPRTYSGRAARTVAHQSQGGGEYRALEPREGGGTRCP